MKSLDKNYFERIKDSSKPEKLRLRMIEILKDNDYNVAKTARMLHTTRKTVMKWWERYQEEGIEGLHDKSRKPKNSPKKTPENVKKLIIIERKIREKLNKKRGPKRIQSAIKEIHGIHVSDSTVYKILRENGVFDKDK
jgi:transposase